jgi:hypothetical protein
MARGDAITAALSSVAAGAFLDMQPSAGVEWVIHNISAPTTATIEVHYGSSAASVCTMQVTGGVMGVFFHCTNTTYYRVKNAGDTAVDVGYDGMVTKGT